MLMVVTVLWNNNLMFLFSNQHVEYLRCTKFTVSPIQNYNYEADMNTQCCKMSQLWQI